MHPRNSLKFLCLFGVLLLLATFAPNNLSSPFALAQAQTEPDSASPQHASSPNRVLVFGLSATNDSPKPVGVEVTLVATVTVDTPLTYLWKFGDGQTATGRVVKHAYAANGTYSTLVIASTLDNKINEEATTLVAIGGTPPPPTDTPKIAGLDASCKGPIVARNTTSCIATVTQGTDVTFLWNFGDNTEVVQGSAVSHIYAEPGTYTVVIYASNPYGPSQQISIQVQVTEQPVAGVEIVGEERIVVNTDFILTATINTGTNVQYSWTFGDGTTDVGRVTRPHHYNKPGTYDVSVVAFNSISSGRATKPITIRSKLPENFTLLLNNSPQPVGRPITFVAVVTTKDPVIYHWDFGDGSFLEGPDINVQHTYQKLGKYLVTVTATTNDDSLTDFLVAYVSVSKPEQLIAVSISPRLILPNQPITFMVMNPQPGFIYEWVFAGGGKTTYGDEPAHTVAIHIFEPLEVSQIGSVSGGNPKEPTGQMAGDFPIKIGSQLNFPLIVRFDTPTTGQPSAPNPPPTEDPAGNGIPPTGLETTTPIPVTPGPTDATVTPTPTNSPEVTTESPTATFIPTAPAVVAPTDTPVPTDTATATPESPTDVVTETAPIEPGGTIPRP